MKISTRIRSKLSRFADHPGYGPLVAFLAAVDAYVLVVPNEALLVSAVLINKKRWGYLAWMVSVGSAVGAVSFAALASRYGEPFVNAIAPHVLQSKTWVDFTAILDHHSLWGLALISFSPFPQHAAVAMVGLAHVKLWIVFTGVLVGRAAKYFLVAAATVYAPQVLQRLHLMEPEPSAEKKMT